MQAHTLTTPNRYAAQCVRCGGRILAGQGLLARTPDGWAADHDGDCPTPAPAAATITRPDRDGIYRSPDGAIYKVQIAHNGSGRLYAKRLTIADGHGRFDYAPGAIHTLHAGWRLTLDEARQYGRLYGCCVACGATLTDEKSIADGIGPICGKRYFA